MHDFGVGRKAGNELGVKRLIDGFLQALFACLRRPENC